MGSGMEVWWSKGNRHVNWHWGPYATLGSGNIGSRKADTGGGLRAGAVASQDCRRDAAEEPISWLPSHGAGGRGVANPEALLVL
jgi:hypothetical protein